VKAAAEMEANADGPRVLRELQDGVLRITLNRPRRKNAFDAAQWREFAAALRGARADDAVSVLLVAGAGGDFSAGVDVRSLSGSDAGTADGFARTMEELLDFDKPLLAAASGAAVGFGATFLLHCDVVFVGESLRLRFPFVPLGLVPEAGSSYLLQAHLGPRRAAEFLFTADWIGAARAVESGLANRALPDDALQEAAWAAAREIAAQPLSALRATKRTLMASRETALRAALDAEARGMREQVGSPENLEAMRAFFEKRAPDFRKLRN